MAKGSSKGGGKPIPRIEVKLEVSPAERSALLKTLQDRFEKGTHLHPGLEWSRVQERLAAQPGKLKSLQAMEVSGGEPDVIGFDSGTGEFIFCDCSPESPAGRRSICYDGAGEGERVKQGVIPAGNAVDLAAEMGIELLDEAGYRELQGLAEFDTKTQSWLRTPDDIRDLGGAIFGDRRFGRVFAYHNTAGSFYSSRGFRGRLRV